MSPSSQPQSSLADYSSGVPSKKPSPSWKLLWPVSLTCLRSAFLKSSIDGGRGRARSMLTRSLASTTALHVLHLICISHQTCSIVLSPVLRKGSMCGLRVSRQASSPVVICCGFILSPAMPHEVMQRTAHDRVNRVLVQPAFCFKAVTAVALL